MTGEQFISIILLFRGTSKQVKAALTPYQEIRRIVIGVICKISETGTKLRARSFSIVANQADMFAVAVYVSWTMWSRRFSFLLSQMDTGCVEA